MKILRALQLGSWANDAAEWLWRLLTFPFALAAPVLGPPLAWFAKREDRIPEPWRGLLEWGVIVLGLISLWPYILGVRTAWYVACLAAVILLLAAVAVCRFYRVKWALEERLGRGGAELPYTPIPGVPYPPAKPPDGGDASHD